jgi:hypothetical protein
MVTEIYPTPNLSNVRHFIGVIYHNRKDNSTDNFWKLSFLAPVLQNNVILSVYCKVSDVLSPLAKHQLSSVIKT